MENQNLKTLNFKKITLTFNETKYLAVPYYESPYREEDLRYGIYINDVKTPYYLEYYKSSSVSGWFNLRNEYQPDKIIGTSINHTELTLRAMVDVIETLTKL